VNITRQQQILSLIRRLVSAELAEINHELFHSAVVTSVILSNDGREARVWVDASEDKIVQLNGKYHHEIQHKFTKKFARKVVPRIVFMRDEGDVDRINSLLEKL